MQDKPHLVVIHGLLTPRIQTHSLMSFMKKKYMCHYFSYSVKETIPEITARLHELVQSLPSFNVMTFSFGAIIIRNYAASYTAKHIARVVMAAPPNAGSELLRAIMKTGTGQRLFGELCADFVANEDHYLPLSPELKAGVIVGTVAQTSPSKAINTFVSKLFDASDSDGKVKRHETTLPYTHTSADVPYRHDDVIRKRESFVLAHTFIQSGTF